MGHDPRHALGGAGEQIAAEHLVRLGYKIVDRNHRTRFGELDVIAQEANTLVFCEVKTRRSPGTPFEALHERKRLQVRRMAAAYLASMPASRRYAEIRFDAIGVVLDGNGRLISLDHLVGAF